LALKKNHSAEKQLKLPILGIHKKKLVKTGRKSRNSGTHDAALPQSIADSVVLPPLEVFCRLATPKPTSAFATYWEFAQERQSVFLAKLMGQELRDANSIIRQHRFTNVYRASDRVSQYLIRHVLYDSSWSPADLVFRLMIFKFFNKVETWEALEQDVGSISFQTYSFEKFDRRLSYIMASGQRIYSAAYIMPSGRTAFGYERKHRNHLKIIEAMIETRLAEKIIECKSFEALFRLLRQHPCVGPFLGYQLAIDLNYSNLLNFSEDEFVEPGPGALDGISKCFSDLGDFTPADIIRYMTDIQETAFDRYAPRFQDLWGRRLHLIDCQNIFCEVSKYTRVFHPEIRGLSNRTRIKQVYRPSAQPAEKPWFPPKWGLNQLIASDDRIRI